MSLNLNFNLQKYKGHSRPDMTAGCDEKLDFEFVRWVLFDGRKKESRAKYKKVISDYKDKVVVIKNQKQLDKFMEDGFEGNDRNCRLSAL